MILPRGSLCDEDAFDDILAVLKDEFLAPGWTERIPTLGMDGDHEILWDSSFAKASDYVVRRVEGQSLIRPQVLILRNFVPYADFVAVPTAAGVCEIKDL